MSKLRCVLLLLVGAVLATKRKRDLDDKGVDKGVQAGGGRNSGGGEYVDAGADQADSGTTRGAYDAGASSSRNKEVSFTDTGNSWAWYDEENARGSDAGEWPAQDRG